MLGKHYGLKILRKYGKYFKLNETKIKKTQNLINKHTGKTIILGRFNTLTRSFAPFIAGGSGSKIITFLLYNTIGTFSWSTTYVLVGFLFWKSYEVLSSYINQFIIFAVIASSIMIYLFYKINKKKKVFDKKDQIFLFTNIFSLYFFLRILEDIYSKGIITKLDIIINSIQIKPITETILENFNILTSPFVEIIIIIALFIVLCHYKSKKLSLLFILALFTNFIVNYILKIIIKINRPENGLVKLESYSFPSLDITLYVLIISLIIYFFWEDMRKMKTKVITIITSLIVVSGVILSELFLNYHWFSDIIASIFLAIIITTFWILIFKISKTYFPNFSKLVNRNWKKIC
jgi:membrane-associated phospholipid phosphatase